MFHYILWKVEKKNKQLFIINQNWWIEVFYEWKKSDWEFFLFPYINENKKTIQYFAFDTINQKENYENLSKISGIWPKTAFQIAQIPTENLSEAIQNFDIKFFQNIPGIWPKTAKKILLQLKDTIKNEDLQQLNIDQKLYKNIVDSLKNFGYESTKIKEVLQKYPNKITKENITEVIKRIISKI